MTRLIREQRGIALPVALGVLVVVSVLSASVFAVSLRLSHTSTASRDAKRALSAADAGIEAAVFEMNKIGLQEESKCFTTVAVPTAFGTDPITGTTPAAGECAGASGDLGNGSRYTYFVTPALDEGDVCAGLPVNHTDSEGKVTVTQRCITSVGQANGERRRVQARVASYIGAKLFPVGGILALNGIKTKNTAIVGGVLGSNGQIELGNNSQVSGGIELGSVSTPLPTGGNGTNYGDVSYRSDADGAFVLAPVDMGNTATVNDNGRISTGQDAGVDVSYNAASRSLSVGKTLTLGGGTYNFCKITLSNGALVKVAQGAIVRLFLDSPDRTGSGCIPSGMTAAQARAAGWGGMSLGQNSNFTYDFGHAIHFQIYMYGYNDKSHTVNFFNGNTMNVAIYAPQSTLIWNNQGAVTGGIAANKVEFKNTASFTWAGEDSQFSLGELRTDTVSVYYRMAWIECRRGRTASTDPESGC
jgi:hypothetical protein